ncbi:TetR/AcrR family transcriptional regulator [Verrucomicrobium spinosum]|uniref:TetR/AcrR family transcriptional regulator n=1 Tax=Verrucomicrobium spinosum TaxID=2736 RepID=UPI0001744B19|nr:TetR/AcrR family transcriptional regulator [Verrucomicrobium spinosum]
MSDARNQILSTAAMLFAGRGYELVGINEIIEKSGVAKATFYAHFKSKEKLCLEWLKADAAETAAAHEKLLADPRPPVEKVVKKFDGLRRYVKSSDFRGCPFSITASMLETSSEVRETIRLHKAGNREFWQRLAAQVRGGASAESRLLGDTLFLLYSGAVMESQNARSTWPAESARTAALALCEGLPA